MDKKKSHELVGKVVSASNNKTITVLVETHKMHPLYHKRVKSYPGNGKDDPVIAPDSLPSGTDLYPVDLYFKSYVWTGRHH